MTSAEQIELLISIGHGRDITLSRPNGLSIDAVAVKGSTRGEMIGNDGTQTEFHLVDWLVTVEQVGELNPPIRGDTITWCNKTYTVTHPDQGQPAVPFHGSDETAYRIHTVKEA